jgi:hypothetical protein
MLSVIKTTTRGQSFQLEMRTVMDDGRISLMRVRQELREARRVLEVGSTDSSVRFWLDRNQDGVMQDDEVICYAVAEIADTGTYELLRWDGATEEAGLDDCSVDPPPAHARSIARTFVTEDVFSFEPWPSADPQEPRTRLVTIEFLLDARIDRGPQAIQAETTVRLRNVH